MTVEQIMELVSDYASEIADIASSESVFAHIGKSRYAYRDKTLAELRTAIEELAADAARYQWLRHNGLKLSFSHELSGLLLSNKTELDAAMKEST